MRAVPMRRTVLRSEESRDLVAKPEVENFLDDVDALRERADRLDARVRRLARARGKPIA